MSTRVESTQLAIVDADQQELRGNGPDERGQHVPLRVPWVALRPEKRLRTRTQRDRRRPLDELVRSADRQTDRRHQEEQPLPGHQRRAAKEHLSRQDRRNEALEKMAEAIVVVAVQLERALHPETQRNALVGVV